MKLVEARDVSKWYGEVVGLNSFCVAIGSGITGLVGPNGAGKTTFIRLMAGLSHQNKGELSVLGEQPFDNPSLISRIGYCPDHEMLYPSLNAATFLAYMARMHGYDSRESRKRALNCLDMVGLSVRTRPMGTFSKGMKQRVKIAQALLNDPELLILDEPFSGVDPVIRVHLFDLINGLAKEGLHVIISSHILYDIERLATNIVLMNDGKMILSGDISRIVDVVEDYTHSIMIRTHFARELGSLLLSKGYADKADISSDNSLLIVTKHPNKLYAALPSIVTENGFKIESLAPVGNDLQSIFERVVR
ncbi:MAG: ABC transporter ATP-binding protein [Candidatus Methanofastidiosia archaeon]